MQRQSKKAATTDPMANHNNHHLEYKDPPLNSSESLKDQIGLLLCHLHSPINQRQRAMGWKLFEILLVQYLVVKGGIQ